MMMPLSERTARLSGALSYFTLFSMAALLAICLWIMFEPETVYAVILGVESPDLIGWPIQTGLLVLGAASLLGAQWTLWNMYLLFRKYAAHEAFTQPCAIAIRRVGYGLILLAVLSLINDPALTILASLGKEEGSMSVTFSSNDIGLLLCGGLLWLIGQVMSEAARQADDLRSFV